MKLHNGLRAGVLGSAEGPRRDAMAALINLIAANGPTSRSDAMTELGWSRAKITRIATDLIDGGVLSEFVPDAPSKRGRPTASLRLVVDNTAVLGIDFGFRSVRTIVASADHTILSSQEEELSFDYGPEEGLGAVRALTDRALAELNLGWDDLIGAGIAISGPIDYENNAPSLKSLLPNWEGDVLSRAAAYLPTTLTLGNDTRLACYAELLWGSGRQFDDFIYFKLHSGTGGALVLNRRIVSGASGAAGEFGHMTVEPTGAWCRCGGRGCLETVVGVPAIMRRLGAVHGANITWPDVRAKLQDGDAATERAFEDAYEAIGRATASLCNILNPQAVILGGALSRSSSSIERIVSEGIRRNALPACADTPVIVGKLGRNAAALGAVGAVLMRGIV